MIDDISPSSSTTAITCRHRSGWALARRWAGSTAVGVVLAATVGSTVGHAEPTLTPTEIAPAAGCALLHVVVAQGTTESSVDQDPKSDAGTLSAAVLPALAAFDNDKSKIDRTYVAYPADFGWKGKPFAESASEGISRMTAVLDEEHKRCPTTKYGIVGYSQGGLVASTLLRRIGAGQGPIPPALVAMGLVLSDPARVAGSPLFPGRSASQVTPDPAPGTSGAAVKAVAALAQPTAPGGGIAPPMKNTPTTFGQLTGRVASKCAAGDIACDTPADAPIARLVTNVAGQLNMNTNDPVGILMSVANVFGSTAIKTAADVVNDNISTSDGTTAGLSYQPSGTSLSEHLAVASNPEYQTDIFSAIRKVVGIGINTAFAVAKKVVTAENIAQIASVGLTNPAAGLALFGAKLGQAALQMLPTNFIDKAATAVMGEIKSNITDNAGLIKMATDTRYWAVRANHESYKSDGATADGRSSLAFTADWLIAVVKDLAAGGGSPQPDAQAFTATTPVAGDDSYQGLPGLQWPTDAAATESGQSYNPWTSPSTGAAPVYSGTSSTSSSTAPTSSTSTTVPTSSTPAPTSTPN